MKASETTLQSVIEGSKQYIVPLYQRSYSWEEKEWQALWDDLVELCEPDGPRTHFLGSLVTMQTTSVPEGVPKFFLIDGQQRLTTLFILLTLLRDRAARDGEPDLAEEIEKTLLVNAYKKGNEYFKILPTQTDREAFRGIVLGGDAPDPTSLIGRAYRFFDRRFGPGPGVRAILKAIAENLSIVSIVLDRDDNPYLVFESLNATGKPLTQADLIRNFFFLKIHSDQQDEMHARYWEPIEKSLDRRLTDFIRHYLMKKGVFVRGDSVYFTLKERLGAGDAPDLLADLARSGAFYARLLRPEEEADPGLRSALGRLNRLDVTTAYPFLLHCYDEVQVGTLTTAGMAEIVGLLENFIVRRFVCNVPTNQLNKLFPPLYNQIKAVGYTDLVEGVRHVLPSKGYPGDPEFRARVMAAKLYGAGDRRARTKFLLETIEQSFRHKEAVDLHLLNIEHVMPQTLSDAWRVDLGEDWEATYQLMLDTLGNLTLTGYNSELSNQPFAAKKGLLAQSHVEMNRYFESVERWDADEIDRRAEALADRAVAIWPNFGDDPAGPEPAGGDKPKTLNFRGTEHPVSSWRDVLEHTVEAISGRSPEALEELAAEMPRLIGRDPSRFLSARQLQCGLFLNVHFSQKDIARWCQRVLDATRTPPGEWSVTKV